MTATITASIQHKEGGIYNINSFSDPDKSYSVDMETGICDCIEGLTGSLCKHQYYLWKHRTASTLNFLPYLSAKERQEYSYIAIGEHMEEQYYEGLHDYLDEDAAHDFFSEML